MKSQTGNSMNSSQIQDFQSSDIEEQQPSVGKREEIEQFGSLLDVNTADVQYQTQQVGQRFHNGQFSFQNMQKFIQQTIKSATIPKQRSDIYGLPGNWTLRTYLKEFNLSSPLVIFDGFKIKLKAVAKFLGCDEANISLNLKNIKYFRFESDYLVRWYQDDSDYKTITTTSAMHLNLHFYQIFQLSFQETRLERNPRFLFLTHQLSFEEEEPKKRGLMRLFLKNGTQIGILRRALINFDKNCFNFRVMNFNIMPYVSNELPYSVVLLFRSEQVECLMHRDLIDYFNIQGCPLTNIEFQFVSLKYVIEVFHHLNLQTKLATFKFNEGKNMYKATMSPICAIASEKYIQQVTNISIDSFGFLPVIYDVIDQVSSEYQFPSLVSTNGKDYIRFTEIIKTRIQDWKIQTLNSNLNQISVISWNLQNNSLISENKLKQLENPVSYWPSYKKVRFSDTIKLIDPDLVLLSEAQPAQDFIKLLDNQYKLLLTKLNTHYKVGQVVDAPQFQNIVVSGILFRKEKFELLEQVDVFPSLLAYDKDLIAKVIGSIVNNDLANNCESHNTNTIAVLKNKITNQSLIAVAMYPVWQPELEPIKLLNIIYTLYLVKELQFKYETDILILGGDMNILPKSAIHQLLSGAKLSTQQCDEATLKSYQSCFNKYSKIVSFQQLFGADTVLSLERYGKLHDIYKMASDDVEKEQITLNFTFKSASYKSILDYIFVQNVRPVELLTPYQPAGVLGNFACPSDHICIGGTLQ